MRARNPFATSWIRSIDPRLLSSRTSGSASRSANRAEIVERIGRISNSVPARPPPPCAGLMHRCGRAGLRRLTRVGFGATFQASPTAFFPEPAARTLPGHFSTILRIQYTPAAFRRIGRICGASDEGCVSSESPVSPLKQTDAAGRLFLRHGCGGGKRFLDSCSFASNYTRFQTPSVLCATRGIRASLQCARAMVHRSLCLWLASPLLPAWLLLSNAQKNDRTPRRRRVTVKVEERARNPASGTKSAK